MVDSPRQPADRARDGQSDLAVPLRTRPGEDAERFRSPRPPADASRVARSPRDAVHQGGLVGEGDAPADHAERHVPAGVSRSHGRLVCGRTGEPPVLRSRPVLIVPTSAIECRRNPRRDPHRQWRTGPVTGDGASLPDADQLGLLAARTIQRGLRPQPAERLSHDAAAQAASVPRAVRWSGPERHDGRAFGDDSADPGAVLPQRSVRPHEGREVGDPPASRKSRRLETDRTSMAPRDRTTSHLDRTRRSD